MAEGVGFEPTEAFTSHAFQACRFGRSRTLPKCCYAEEAGYLVGMVKVSPVTDRER